MSDNLHMEDKETPTEASEVPLTKAKKPRTQKQLEAFEIARQKRAASIENKKKEKKIEASKILLQEEEKKRPLKGEPLVDSSSVEEEIQVVYAKKEKKKKPKKKIVVVSESSDSESTISDHIPKRKFVSQQNKKSVIKVHEPKYDPKKFFLD